MWVKGSPKRVVYKYPVSHNQSMPVKFQILRAGHQNGQPFLWILVDKEQPEEIVHFHTFGTGQDVPENAVYVGGYSEPPFEWHVFQVFK